MSKVNPVPVYWKGKAPACQSSPTRSRKSLAFMSAIFTVPLVSALNARASDWYCAQVVGTGRLYLAKRSLR